MDPVVIGVIVAGLLGLTAITPALRQRVARDRDRQLREHGLVVVDDPLDIVWSDARQLPNALPVKARRRGEHVVVTVDASWTAARTRFLTARHHLLERRHERRAAGGLIGQLHDVDGFPVGGILPTAALLKGAPHDHVWRELDLPGHPAGSELDGCFVSGGPRAALDLLAGDDVVRAALGALTSGGAQLSSTKEQLVFRWPRNADLQEKQVRQCLDAAAAVVAALEAVAVTLPDLEPRPGGPVDDDVAVSSAGSPFAVRSIDR